MFNSARFREDLRAIHIKGASKVVIFSTPSVKNEGEESLIDSETMYISLNIEKEATGFKKDPKNVLVMELLNDGNMLFLDLATHLVLMKEKAEEEYAKQEEKIDGLMTPFFASGKVFSSAIFDIVLAQASFIPEIIPLIKIFSSSQTGHQQNARITLIPSHLTSENEEDVNNVYDFRRQSFSDIFSTCIQRKILPFALFRKPSNEFEVDHAVHDYVVCMPEHTTILRDSDQIYAFVEDEQIAIISKMNVPRNNRPFPSKSDIQFDTEVIEFIEDTNFEELNESGGVGNESFYTRARNDDQSRSDSDFENEDDIPMTNLDPPEDLFLGGFKQMYDPKEKEDN